MIDTTDERLDALKKYGGSITVGGEDQDEIVLRMKLDNQTAERVYGELCEITAPSSRADRRECENEEEEDE